MVLADNDARATFYAQNPSSIVYNRVDLSQL